MRKRGELDGMEKAYLARNRSCLPCRRWLGGGGGG